MNANPKPRILVNFARFKIAELILFCRYVIASLTGNANFTTLNPTLAVATASVEALEAAKEVAMDGGRTAKLLAAQAKASTVDVFRQLGGSVQNLGNYDRAILSSSGFGVTKVPTPVGPIGPPDAPKLAFGKDPGEIKARVTKARGVSSIVWRIALASAPTVYLETTSTPAGRYTFKGLTAGTVYTVQACAVGSEGQSGWSAAAMLMAL